jgi:tRNA(Ile2) C34 agmatinyltransferase TiaS
MCPMCNGPGVVIGSWGRLTYFRCRNCGWDFTQDQPVEEDSAGAPTHQAHRDDGDEP